MHDSTAEGYQVLEGLGRLLVSLDRARSSWTLSDPASQTAELQMSAQAKLMV